MVDNKILTISLNDVDVTVDDMDQVMMLGGEIETDGDAQLVTIKCSNGCKEIESYLKGANLPYKTKPIEKPVESNMKIVNVVRQLLL